MEFDKADYDKKVGFLPKTAIVGRPLWQRMLGAHLSSDENWALTLSRGSQGQSVGYWFLIGAGATLMLAWVCSSVLGLLFASGIPDPETYAIDFAFTAAFIAISRSLWRGRQDAAPWVTAVGVVIDPTYEAAVASAGGLHEASWVRPLTPSAIVVRIEAGRIERGGVIQSHGVESDPAADKRQAMKHKLRAIDKREKCAINSPHSPCHSNRLQC